MVHKYNKEYWTARNIVLFNSFQQEERSFISLFREVINSYRDSQLP